MFEIKEKQKVLPDGTRITTFIREVASANVLEVEVGTDSLKGGSAEHGSRTYFRITDLGNTDMFVKATHRPYSNNTESVEFISLETQRSHYDEYIRAHKDWELVNVYYDEGISGTRADTRPGLQMLMADCRLRRIDMVLTKSISRLQETPQTVLPWCGSLYRLTFPSILKRKASTPPPWRVNCCCR